MPLICLFFFFFFFPLLQNVVYQFKLNLCLLQRVSSHMKTPSYFFILCVILASNVSSSSNRSCIFFFLSHPTSFLCMSPVFGGSIAHSLHCWTTYFVKITQSVGKPNQMIISGCTETNPLASSSIQCV